MSQIPKITGPVSDRRIFNYACWLLARRRYSQSDLTKKLQKKFPEQSEENEKIIQLFLKKKYLDDQQYATLFIHEQLNRKPQGLRTIKQKLRQKGISEPLLSQVFAAATTTTNQYSEDTLIQKALSKKIILLNKMRSKGDPDSHSPLSQQKIKQKLYRFLASRGFSPGAIMKALKHHDDAP